MLDIRETNIIHLTSVLQNTVDLKLVQKPYFIHAKIIYFILEKKYHRGTLMLRFYFQISTQIYENNIGGTLAISFKNINFENLVEKRRKRTNISMPTLKTENTTSLPPPLHGPLSTTFLKYFKISKCG